MIIYTYDNAGNITKRCEYGYTEYTVNPNGDDACRHYSYDYDGDKIINYVGEKCEYNSLGNPTIYNRDKYEWQYWKWLTKCGSTNFEYDGLGRRTKAKRFSTAQMRKMYSGILAIVLYQQKEQDTIVLLFLSTLRLALLIDIIRYINS